MQATQLPKTFLTWYLSNLAGWILGFVWIAVFSIALNGIHLYRFEEGSFAPYVIFYAGPILEPIFTLVPPIVCVLFVQRLMFRRWQVKFGIYQWIAANVKGVFLAFIILFMVGLLVGVYQRPILDFLYGSHTQTEQTYLILTLIFVLLPLLGSIGTSTMITVDVFEWKFRVGNVVAE